MSPDRKKWSEFDWEREIRKDEARINNYLNELKHFIDLPDEEELILKRMQRNPELVLQNSDFDNMGFQDMLDDFEVDEDFFSGDEWRKKKGADIYIAIEKLAFQWNIIFASELEKKSMSDGMRITCRYGKLLARVADVLDVNSGEYPNLKIALCKRLVAELNILAGELASIAENQKNLRIKMDSQLANLQTIREKIIDFLSDDDED